MKKDISHSTSNGGNTKTNGQYFIWYNCSTIVSDLHSNMYKLQKRKILHTQERGRGYISKDKNQIDSLGYGQYFGHTCTLVQKY